MTSKIRIKTVYDLLESLGGAARLASRLDIHQFTVDRWIKNGIPVKYWEQIIKLSGVSAETLYIISRKANAKKL